MTVAGVYLLLTTVSVAILGWLERRYNVAYARSAHGP
jgi:ABC-type arginine transport system permease subunit